MAFLWSRGRQLLILLWKNFILQVRRPIGTVVELLVPPVACMVIIILRFTLFEVENRCHLTFDPDPLTLPVPHSAYQLYYSPNTSQAANEVADILRGQEFYWTVRGVATEQELVDELTTINPPPPPITLSNSASGVNLSVGCFVGGAGVVFDSLEGEDLEYTLRLRHEAGEADSWHTREAAFWFQAPGARVTDNAYLAEGFLHLQNRVGRAIVEWRTQQTNLSSPPPPVQVSVKQIPHPSYRIDAFLNWNSAILPLLLIMASIYSAGMFTKELVLEKESRIRESMLMMGLRQWVLWTSWFIKQLLFLFVSSLIVTILLKYGQVFPESNVLLLLLFFTLFATASISWGFFISVWFSSARLGMVFSFVAWFFIYIPFFYIPQNYHVFSLPVKLGLCVLTNTCMGLGVTLVSEWEVRQEGLTLDTLLRPLTIEDGFHMGWVLVMLLVDTILFLLIAWYVNEVKPGRYGVPRPFYFPLQPSYWTGRPWTTTTAPPEVSARGGTSGDLHEEEPQDMTIGISVQNLIKIYDDNKLSRCCQGSTNGETKRMVAVDGLNLNMFEGQITALLGHNGAGKTTTISILTGLYTPTAGTAVINGYDIRTNMDQIRHSLGICPQHNVLFDRLTVLEHLKLFARLKGVHGGRVQEAADAMIEDLQLQDKRNTPSRNLSGGMKRKLSVGIALIGGSKTVVLDEPTSGMDPYARRATWDLLAKHKEGRTILLTTHFMDEADLLGDRIAIMAEGRLMCSGSSLFLKSRYGVGYHMVIVKEPFCDTTKVSELVLGKVPGSQVVTDVGAELSFILPSSATHHFPRLFDTLQVEQGELGVSSYGISVTTMEEVFMKVREGANETLTHRLERSATAGTLSSHPPPLPPAPLSPSSQPSPHSPHSPHSPVTAQHRTVVTTTAEVHDCNTNLISPNNISSIPDNTSPHHTDLQQEMEMEGLNAFQKRDKIGRSMPSVVAVAIEQEEEQVEMFPDERYPKMYCVSWGVEGGRTAGEEVTGATGEESDKEVVGSGGGGRCEAVLEIEGVCMGESGNGDTVSVADGRGSGDTGDRIEETDTEALGRKEGVHRVPTPLSLTPPSPPPPPPRAHLNTGSGLWLQRYRGMLVKRVYTSVRFWQAMATQLVLPLFFVGYAMVLARTILFTDDASDPQRRLGLRESSLGLNRTLFWAEFGSRDMDREGVLTAGNSSSSFFDFTDQLLADSLGATDLQDYTERVLDLVSSAVQTGRDSQQCCGYSYQMLDKYCASRTVEELDTTCSHIISFPYHHCSHCLSCCESRVTRLPSCTHPLTQPTSYEESQFCPSSPQVSLQDLLTNSTSGPLDTFTAYVDEVLMHLSHQVTAPVFTRRIMGGFVVQHTRDPPFSVCGCSNTQTVCRNSFAGFQECEANNSSRPIYIVPSLAQSGFCPVVGSNYIKSGNDSNRNSDGRSSDGGSGDSGSGNGGSGDSGSGDGGMAGDCDFVEFKGHYEVDGLSADLLHQHSACGCGGNVTGRGCECGEGEGESMVSAHYYQEQEETLSVTVWYNNRPWHMSAAALNAFHNVWLRQATNNSSLRLTINNHPLPRTNLDRLADVEQANLDGYYVGITVVFGYSFLVASFVLILVAEKESKAKHLQFVSGATVSSYWLAHLTWDLLNSLLPLGLSLTIIAAARVEAYSGIALLTIACLLLLTCWSSIPIVYTASFLFTNSLIAFGVILVSFFISCLIFFLVTLVIQDEVIKDSLHYVFLLNPAYALGIGLNDVYINHFLKEICTFTPLARQSCAMNGVRFVDNLFSLDRPGIGILLIYMSLEGIFFFLLTLLIERQFFMKEMSKLCKGRKDRRKLNLSVHNSLFEMKPVDLPSKDSDVEEEAERVRTGQVDCNSAVIIQNLVKVYRRSLDGFRMRPAKTAVQGISVAIPTGECFGLLGVNGAGKTTTFNILIGDTAPTSGTAIISGYNIRTDLRKIRQLIGYCPQFDALIERMTGRELLTMFARLRGIPESLISQAVEAEVARLDLSKHASKQCGKYSGGNKRKLSTAIALIGNPPIILLDEPTTGMDPGTRRYLWDVLTGVTREGRSIILTTHSMEECEALCTRLAIMVNGQFKCLGSIQHLKNKYGSGYSLQAKVRRSQSHSSGEKLSTVDGDTPHDLASISSSHSKKTSMTNLAPVTTNSDFDTSGLHKFIKDTFPGAHLLEEHQGAVTYQLGNKSLRWATVFREMERNRDRLGVTDYSVSQTTLEQVFVNFAKDQAEVEETV